MDNKTYSVWNPLEFLSQTESLDILDLDEIHHLGQRTLQIATEQHVELSYQGSKIVGREVGDDRVDLCRHVDPLCATLAVQEDVIQMVTSAEDTSIRKRSWNFCEVTSGPLTDPHQGFDYIRKEGTFENLGFNDSVVLRIILDVQKGEGEEHSSTQPGKMSMLGSRLATPRRENRGYWMLASLFQDSMLATHKASEPKYLPPVMGGTGVTALFDNPNNVFLYTLAYKGGKYRRIYATAVAEMRSYLYNLERGLQSAPILCPRLREKQEYFWGTYHNMVFIPESITVGDRDRPPEPLYKATGGQNRYQAFENRLLRTRHVVTRKQASVEWMHSRRLRHIFLGLFPTMKEFEDLDLVQSRTLRARYNNALNANSALQNLLQKKASASDVRQMTGDRNFRLLTVGKLDFTRDDALWVFLNGQGENYSLRDVTLSEDIFVRGEVSIEETFKVGGIRLRPYLSSGAKEQLTKTKIGLYQINKPMEEWAEDLLSRLIIKRDELHRPLDPTEVGPIFDQDREWVNDDSGLVATCLRDTCDSKATHSVLLVSSDRRLANQMAETCNVNVIRLSPHEFVKIAHSEGKEISSEINCNFLKGKYNLTFDYGYVDTGSLHASACHYMEEDGKLYHRTLLSTGWEGETRYSKSTLTLAEKVRIKKELHRPVTRPRKWSHGSRPYESVYSSHSSWKQSVRSQRSELSNWWRPCGRIPER